MRAVSVLLPFFLSLATVVFAQANPATDTDGDGLNDALEQRLLVQFAPTFMVSAHDCAGVPA
jgi:hypothetical protein